MLLPDVNVLVYAHRGEMKRHESAKTWLENALEGDEPFAVFDPIMASFLRIITNRRIFKSPTPMSVALEFVEKIRTAPSALLVHSTEDTWKAFQSLCQDTPALGDDIADAYLAAVAITTQATLISSDNGFSRFKGLSWRSPLNK